jgi:hypothetical protein
VPAPTRHGFHADIAVMHAGPPPTSEVTFELLNGIRSFRIEFCWMDNSVFEQCWNEILNPTPGNQDKATEILQSLYSIPESIPVLLSYLESHRDPRVRMLALYGLRNALESTRAACNEWFERLLIVIQRESDPEVVRNLVIPANVLFQSLGSRWELIAGFINDSVESYPQGLVIVLAGLAAELPRETVCERVGYFARVIESVLDSSCAVSVGFELVFLDTLVIGKLTDQRNEFVEVFAEKFTRWMVEVVLEAPDRLLLRILQVVLVSFECGPVRYRFAELLQPLVEVMTKSANSGERRLICAALLGGFLEYDPLPLAEDAILALIDAAMQLTPLAYADYGTDDSVAAQSMGINGLLAGCFGRISKATVGSVVSSLCQELLESNPIMAFILLYEGLSRTPDAFSPREREIFQCAIQACASGDRFLRDWIVIFLCDSAKFFRPLLDQDPMDFVRQILESRLGQEAQLEVLQHFVATMDNTDALLRVLFPEMARIIASVQSDRPLKILCWALLNSLIHGSVEATLPIFPDLWRLCVTHLQGFHSRFSRIGAMQAISMLASKSPELMRRHVRDIVPAFMEDLRTSDRTLAFILLFFAKIIAQFPTELRDAALFIIPGLFEMCIGDDIFVSSRFTCEHNGGRHDHVEAAISALAGLVLPFRDIFITHEGIGRLRAVIETALSMPWPGVVSAVCSLLRTVMCILDGSAKDDFHDTVQWSFTTLVRYLVNDLYQDRDYTTQTDIVIALRNIYDAYGFGFSEQQTLELFDILLKSMEATKSVHTGEFAYVDHLYQSSCGLMVEIVDSSGGPWLDRFIGRIFTFYESCDCNVQRVTLNIFQAAIAKIGAVPNDEMVSLIVTSALNAISNNVREAIADHCTFLITWVAMQPRLQDVSFISLIIDRVAELQNASQYIDLVNRESLIALLCTLERLAQEPFIHGPLLELILSCLPLNTRPLLNNNIYKWLLWKLDSPCDFPSQFRIFRLLCLPLTDSLFDIQIAPSLQAHVSSAVTLHLPSIQQHAAGFLAQLTSLGTQSLSFGQKNSILTYGAND